MSKESNKSKAFHWTDGAARNIIAKRGDKKTYVVESGITPSGFIHLGNFREAVTQDLVRKGLERAGKKVKFLYVWDDYDVLRKVPKNLPKQDMIKENLGRPVFKVPDPFECHKSYAEHFEKVFEEEMKQVGIECTFMYSHEHYLNCEYADEIKTALENTEKIKNILNEYRREPLAKEWLPIFVFCEKCDKDKTKITWEKGYEVNYTCECGHKDTIDFRKKGIVTLRWRVDWPMRWHHNKVDFESAGKDHFASGGSVTTGREIQKQVYKTEPPVGFMYEWIGIKGKGQFASSAGNVITLTEMLKVYEPALIRYIFAGTRPNREFSISFDTDVLAIYEEFDKVERIYFGEDHKHAAKLKAAYELSMNTIPKSLPYQPSIRHLSMLLQIYNFDMDKVIGYFSKELKNKFDKDRLKARAECAENWVKEHAPEDFRFTVQEKSQVTLSKEGKEILHKVAEKLQEKDWTDKELHEEMYILCTNAEFPPADFFKTAYRVLINKEKGPKLASFILEIGKERVAELFKSV